MDSNSPLPPATAWGLLALGIVLLIWGVAFVLTKRRVTQAASLGGGPSGATRRLPADLPSELTPNMPLARQVAVLLRRGNKIEAIKVVRAQTGLGLKDAKDVVDAIEMGRPLPAGLGDAPGAPVAGASPDTDAEARALLARGRKIEAVKLVRERTGLGLADAKAYVEGL